MPPPHHTIPMPRYVAQLPLIGGMPIPYTTLFVNHDVHLTGSPVYTGYDDTGSPIEKCRCQFGVGRPLLGKPCPHRQRKAMRERRCVTCGRVIGPKSELIFIGVAVHDEHPEVCYSVEPPAHPECAAYSVLVCPEMIRKASRVTIARCRTYDLAQMVAIPAVGPDGKPGHKLAPLGEPVRGGIIDLYAAFPDPAAVSMLSLVEWMRHDAPRKYRTA
jgi:hypothetical protein